MIQITVDTNTLASGSIARRGAVAELITTWRRGSVQFIVSDYLLAELDRSLLKPYFAARLAENDRRAFLTLVREFATVVDITVPIPDVVNDYGDNVVLATARSAETPIIVSGDRELRRLGAYEGIRILSARAFLEAGSLREQGSPPRRR